MPESHCYCRFRGGDKIFEVLDDMPFNVFVLGMSAKDVQAHSSHMEEGKAHSL
jgi:hypothetical protein